MDHKHVNAWTLPEHQEAELSERERLFLFWSFCFRPQSIQDVLDSTVSHHPPIPKEL